MSVNRRNEKGTGPIISLSALLALAGPAQLITVVDDEHGPTCPLYSGKKVGLIRSEDPFHYAALGRTVRHFNTTDDDRARTLGHGSTAVVEVMGGHVDIHKGPRRGILIHLE